MWRARTLNAFPALLLAITALCLLPGPRAADASFPGFNGRVAFVRDTAAGSDIFTYDPNTAATSESAAKSAAICGSVPGATTTSASTNTTISPPCCPITPIV